MLKTKSVTVVTLATEEKVNANYEVSHSITDGVLCSVKCDIIAKTMVKMPTPEGEREVPQLERVGGIELEHGRITPSAFASDLPIAEYLTVFGELVKEITPKEAEVIKTK